MAAMSASKKRAGDVVHAHADAVEAVAFVVEQADHQLGVRRLVAGGGAVLAVEGDVEQGAKLLLQGHRLAHQLLGAAIVIAGWEQQGLAFALE